MGGELAASFQANPKLKDVPIVFLTATVTQGRSCERMADGLAGILFWPNRLSFSEMVACVSDINLGEHDAAERQRNYT